MHHQFMKDNIAQDIGHGSDTISSTIENVTTGVFDDTIEGQYGMIYQPMVVRMVFQNYQ